MVILHLLMVDIGDTVTRHSIHWVLLIHLHIRMHWVLLIHIHSRYTATTVHWTHHWSVHRVDRIHRIDAIQWIYGLTPRGVHPVHPIKRYSTHRIERRTAHRIHRWTR